MICTVLIAESSDALTTRLKPHLKGGVALVGRPVRPAELLDAVRQLSPAVVLLEVGASDAQRAVEAVMADAPVPLLLAIREDGERQQAFSLLAAGALDVFRIPPRLDASTGAALCRHLSLLAKVSVVSHPKGRRRKTSKRLPLVRAPYPVVAIASSLGGPRALADLLSAVPHDFGAPIVVCQHITPGFSDDLALWLEAETGLRVQEATQGQPLVKGEVFIAPAHLHLHVSPSGTVQLDDGPQVGGFKPSCDVMLKSVAHSFGPKAIGVVLTGMGRDGARGLKEIRSRGGHTIAQDEASCVVFGMPKEAIALGAAEHVMPLGEIASQLVRWVS